MRDFVLRSLFLPVVLLSMHGCAGDWGSFGYGPGDWLSDNTALTVDTMNNYERFQEPLIIVNRVESTAGVCGSPMARGCALVQDDLCVIYVGERASPNVIAHEKRHCHGWSHYIPNFDLFAAMGPEFRQRELARARGWYPTDGG